MCSLYIQYIYLVPVLPLGNYSLNNESPLTAPAGLCVILLLLLLLLSALVLILVICLDWNGDREVGAVLVFLNGNLRMVARDLRRRGAAGWGWGWSCFDTAALR